VDQDLTDDIKELQKRINDLEKLLARLIQPLTDARKTTENYLRLAGLLLDHGGLTPDLILPDVKDPIEKDIVRVLLERTDQNVSQITELVKTRRGTASRRIIRKRLHDLEQKTVVQATQHGSRTVYRLSPDVITKWTRLLGFPK